MSFRQDALHHPFDKVVAVMGMDMTLGYFYKLAVEQLPVCEHVNIRCFIMDDRGYLIAHKGNFTNLINMYLFFLAILLWHGGQFTMWLQTTRNWGGPKVLIQRLVKTL